MAEVTQPITKQPPLAPVPPPIDGTLTITPHVISVAAGAFCTWLVTVLHLPPGLEPYAVCLVGPLIASGVHFLQAKIDQ